MSSVPFYAVDTSRRTAECPRSPFSRRRAKPTGPILQQQQLSSPNSNGAAGAGDASRSLATQKRVPAITLPKNDDTRTRSSSMSDMMTSSSSTPSLSPPSPSPSSPSPSPSPLSPRNLFRMKLGFHHRHQIGDQENRFSSSLDSLTMDQLQQQQQQQTRKSSPLVVSGMASEVGVVGGTTVLPKQKDTERMMDLFGVHT